MGLSEVPGLRMSMAVGKGHRQATLGVDQSPLASSAQRKRAMAGKPNWNRDLKTHTLPPTHPQALKAAGQTHNKALEDEMTLVQYL